MTKRSVSRKAVPPANVQIDKKDRAILTALQVEGRVPLAALARRVGLSTPAVTERVRKLESAGVITGYRAEVDQQRIGLPIAAFVRFRVTGGMFGAMVRDVQQHPEVLECHRVTGEACLIMRIAVASIQQLETLLTGWMRFGQGETSIILSSAIPRRGPLVG